MTQFGAPAKSPTPAKRPFRLYGMTIFANSVGPGPFFFHGPNDMTWAMKKKSPEGPSMRHPGEVLHRRGACREGFREGTPPYMNMQGLDMNMDRIQITPGTPTPSGTANLIAHAHSARPNLKVDCFWWIVFGLAAYPKMAKMKPKMANMRPKMAKMRPKMGNMRPKMAKMTPKMAKMRVNTVMMTAKMAKMSLKMTKMSAKMAKMSFKTATMRPKDGQDEAQDGQDEPFGAS